MIGPGRVCVSMQETLHVLRANWFNVTEDLIGSSCRTDINYPNGLLWKLHKYPISRIFHLVCLGLFCHPMDGGDNNWYCSEYVRLAQHWCSSCNCLDWSINYGFQTIVCQFFFFSFGSFPPPPQGQSLEMDKRRGDIIKRISWIWILILDNCPMRRGDYLCKNLCNIFLVVDHTSTHSSTHFL